MKCSFTFTNYCQTLFLSVHRSKKESQVDSILISQPSNVTLLSIREKDSFLKSDNEKRTAQHPSNSHLQSCSELSKEISAFVTHDYIFTYVSIHYIHYLISNELKPTSFAFQFPLTKPIHVRIYE